MNYLQITLLSNALFSLLTGLSLIIFHSTIAGWFGNQNTIVFWVIGIGLLFFSYSVFIQIKSPKAHAVFYIIIQDIIWVLASVVILLINPFNIPIPGNQIIALVAFVVLSFGVGQSLGLAQMDRIKEKGIKRITSERVINAIKEDTWKVISDVSNYHKVAPNLDHVEILSGERKGMIRRCSYKKDSWTEVATLWEEGEKFSFQVNTKAEDFPYPIKYMKGTWKVEEISENQTKITLMFDFTYKRKIQNILIHPFMKKGYNKICEELLDNWQNRLEKE